ncbi:MAG: DUF59 domain-containing protein [Bacteroidales bacterium]|nr:DUF59 domain-containing protein [Candidatus Physcocola equi]
MEDKNNIEEQNNGGLNVKVSLASNEFLPFEEKIVQMLRTVYDPEIPVNIYDLGMIYKIEVDEKAACSIEMTLTAPNCPAADFIMEDVRQKIESIEGLSSVDIQLVFEPMWDQSMMTDEAKLELGLM